jgi:single-strand DNA-binding protein
MYLNQVSLIGFLGKDAELKTTTNNRDFVILSIATGRSWKDKESQEYKRETDWHRIVAWGNLAKFAQKLKKGEHIFVQGELRPHQYGKQVGKGKSKEEVTMYVADIQADTITRLRPGTTGEEAEETASNRISEDQTSLAA